MAQTPNRYALPWTGMVGAMLVVLVLVLGMKLFNSGGAEPPDQGAQPVSYTGWLSSGRQDGRLQMFAPERLPHGWRATSASYETGVAPHWHLGVLSGSGHYVGLEEALATPRELVHQYVDAHAHHGGSVTVHGSRWQTWTDSGGDYALVRSMPAPEGRFRESLLVVGSATPVQVRSFAASLRTGS